MNVLVSFSGLFEYLYYGSTSIIGILIFSEPGPSESDVYRRQILTSKDGPRAERVKVRVVSAALQEV